MRVTRRAGLVPVGLAAVAALAGCNLGRPADVYPVEDGAPSDVAAGDLDGDGDVDLVVPGAVGYVVATNDGAGGFSTEEVPASSMSRGVLTLADLDGDGALDMLHRPQVGPSFVDIRRGDGAGGFSTARTILQTPVPLNSEVLATDVEGDGDLDVVAGTDDGVVVWHREGAAHGPAVGFDLGSYLETVAAGDLNGDGAADLVAATGFQTAPVLLVALADGAGGFGRPQRVGTELLGTGQVTVTLADVTGDGRLDALAGSTDEEPAIALLRGDGSGGFDNTATYESGAYVSRLSTGDLDGDGLLDVVSDDTVLFNDGAGGLTDRHAFVGGARPLAVDVGGDDRADHVAVANTGGGQIRVLVNELDGRTHPGTGGAAEAR